MDFGIPYAIVRSSDFTGLGLNGYTFDSFGAAGALFTGVPYDPDPIGYLRLTGVEGLDQASIRSTVDPRPQSDGGILHRSFLGPRYVSLTGLIVPFGATQAAFDESRRAWQGALRSGAFQMLHTDHMLIWAPEGPVASPDPDEEERYITIRCWEPLQISGGAMKEFRYGLVSPDPWALSVFESSIDDNSAPFSVNALPDGSAPSYPRIRIYGSGTPVTAFDVQMSDGINPVRTLRLAGVSIGSGAHVEIDTWRETIVHSNGTNLIAKLDLSVSKFGPLNDGIGNFWNVVALASVSGTPSKLEVKWNNAWA